MEKNVINMKSPDYLKIGDKVALVAPARKVEASQMEKAISVFRSWGLEVVCGKHLYSSWHPFAGKDFQRTNDLQHALDDPSVRAVFCARGGYGSLRIVDQLCWSDFRKSPKWLVGFSDMTVLHGHINRQCGIQSLHAPMPYNFFLNQLTDDSLESLRKALFGEPLQYQWPSHPLDIGGKAVGLLSGGNLSILAAIRGTASAFETENTILFIEDLDEYLYHIDRMMLSLKRSGYLSRIRALVAGGLTDLKDNETGFGKSAEEIIRECVEDFEIPLVFGFPAGHLDNNMSLPLGCEVVLETGSENTLTFIR